MKVREGTYRIDLYFSIRYQPHVTDVFKIFVPVNFFDQKCHKYILIQPIMHRMLIDLDKQAIDIENKDLPLKQKMKFLREVEYEKRELMDRLALII